MTPINTKDDDGVHIELLHHGVAASSSPNVIACIPAWIGNKEEVVEEEDLNENNNNHVKEETEIVYASHLILNIARIRTLPLLGDDRNRTTTTNTTTKERIWNVYRTLRTRTHVEAEVPTAAANVSTLTAKRVITCVTRLQRHEHQQQQQQQQHDVDIHTEQEKKNDDVLLVCGFSDGTITSWFRDSHGDGTWRERVLHLTQPPTSSAGRSITSLDGYYNIDDGSIQVSIVTCSSGGAHYFCFHLGKDDDDNDNEDKSSILVVEQRRLVSTPSNAVKFQVLTNNILNEDNDNDDGSRKLELKSDRIGIFLVGTAAPRHNKIHVLFVDHNDDDTMDSSSKQQHAVVPTYSGSLAGHEDWITSFDWATTTTRQHPQPHPSNSSPDQSDCGGTYYLASASQDGKIRLWKWVTTKSTSNTTGTAVVPLGQDEKMATVDAIDDEEQDDDDDDDDDGDDEEMLEGEARLEIVHGKDQSLTTSVFLEALLIGHEEMVTSVAWYPNPQQLYGQDLILISSSMDRTIFIWSSTTNSTGNGSGLLSNLGGSGVGEGVWTPVARVGSAGGILGGSIGSSLLGFINVQIEPVHGRWIMGHAYGGALHFFSYATSISFAPVTDGSNKEEKDGGTSDTLAMAMSMPIEERAALVQWRAKPCVTGHFGEVTDLCWDAHGGDYLITVSNDQTCRVWAPLTPSLDAWIEIARPQVHGYNLSAVTSLSTSDHKHLLVTGADEKEMRVFDGTLSFERMLRLVTGTSETSNRVAKDEQATSDRVERAFIPALGLSNKASAIHGAEEDLAGASKSSTLLPLERDLGSTSLWPELRKLFGHNSEIARLTCTLSTRTSLSFQNSTPYYHQVLVASSTKARDVETANIRIWDVVNNRCVQVLKGGHRSTVTAMSFSPDGTYLASSGKDRRLCIWKRSANTLESSEPFFLAAAVESSHKRIVWSVHFCPSEPSIVASGSRDGSVKLWKISGESADERGGTTVSNYAKFVPTVGEPTGGKDEAVTSLAFAPVNTLSTGILAVGLENGMIQLWSVPLALNNSEVDQPYLVTSFDAQICHIGMVTKLEWRPTTTADLNEPALMVLASCSSDNGCRIIKVRIPPTGEAANQPGSVPLSS